MDLLLPGEGLFFWQAIVFITLFFFLAKFAWKPILAGLKEREDSIQQALDAAVKAKEEIANMTAGNEQLIKQAKDERDKIIRDARDAANRLIDQAQGEAKKSADKLIEDAKAVINTEKAAALQDVKEYVAMFSLQIAEKLIKKNLSTDQAQKDLVSTYLKEAKIN